MIEIYKTLNSKQILDATIETHYCR